MDQPLKLLYVTAAILFYSVISPQPFLGTTLNTTVSPLSKKAEQLSQNGMGTLTGSQIPEVAPSLEQSLTMEQELGILAKHNILNQTEKINISHKRLSDSPLSGGFHKIIEISKDSLLLSQEGGQSGSELKRLIALGDAYNSSGNYQQAIDSAEASLALAQKLENPHAQAVAFLILASAYQSLATTSNDYQKAMMAAISSLTTAWKIQDRTSEAKALAILGSVYNSRREKQNALLFSQQSLKVAEENNVPTAAASSLLTLSSVHLEQGKYPQVIASTQQGQEVLNKLKKREEESAIFVMQGLAFLGQGNFQKSQKSTDLGLAIAREIKSSRIEALALIVLSLCYSEERNSPKALELISQSREIAKALKNYDLEELALEVLAEIYRKAGRKELAIAAYQEALSINPTFSALAGLSRLYQESNLLTTAIAYAKKAVNKNEEQIPRIIAGLPVWLQASFPQAIQNINGLSATKIYRSFTSLLLTEKRPIEAQQVLELLKGQELREYTGNSNINRTEQGQPVVLMITPTEQQILREYGSLINFGYQLDQCQKNRCPQLNQLLQQREILTQQYYQSLEQLEATIRQKQALDEAFVDPNQFAQKAQKIVDAQPNTLLIYPLVLDDRIWLMWASKGGIVTSVEVPGVKQAQLEVTVMKFRQLLQNRLSNIDELQATGQQLYDWLLKPLEKELKANKIHNLVFALDRSTRYIPMSALFDGNQYLIENYTISTVLSANLTDTNLEDKRRLASIFPASTRGYGKVMSTPQNPQFIQQDHPKPKIENPKSNDNHSPTILALGVSDAVGGFPPLPNVPPELNAIVRQEVTATQGIYPGEEFLNREFDFFSLRDNLPHHQLLHIATHSKVVPGRANQSFLLLGTGEKLAIPEIETWLDFRNVNLVVLSACETALGGTGMDGREIAGVGYYFLKGGARTVIASLWNVDDQSTRLLMEQFYKHLAQGTLASPVTKAQALRRAQLALLYGHYTAAIAPQDAHTIPTPQSNVFRHPYYWAPFIVMGRGL